MEKKIENITLKSTDYSLPAQLEVYHGKVRDVYLLPDKLVMIATDRISAFDHILPRAIPYKGQILNQIAQYFLEATKDIVPNWWEASPDPNVSIGVQCKPIKIEMVIRGYLAGHSYREYAKGNRTLCGISMPEGMKESDAFPEPIITPATKADEGHDEDISKEEILNRNIVSSEQYEMLENYTRALFERGTKMANEMGLILVDTKYEFGLYKGELYLIDEIHTPDSSRYYYLDGYKERQNIGEKQKQLSKEFVREWLIEQGFQGKEEQIMPYMPDSFVWQISNRYIELFELITGRTFEIPENSDVESRIYMNILNYLSNNPS